MSLPRLELCAAELTAKLTKTSKILSVTGFCISLHAWTDATIVLQWLAQLPKTWKAFVANRVSQIQATLPRSKWRHVPSMDNPADLASRGCVAPHLSKSSLWWNGPDWLGKEHCQWPDRPIVKEDPPEKRAKAQLLVCSTSSATSVLNDENATQRHQSTADPVVDISRFSNYKKLVRVFAYALFFVQKLKKQESQQALSPVNLKIAKFQLLKVDQKTTMLDEYTTASQSHELSRKNNHRNLILFFWSRKGSHSCWRQTQTIALCHIKEIFSLDCQQIQPRASPHRSFSWSCAPWWGPTDSIFSAAGVLDFQRENDEEVSKNA